MRLPALTVRLRSTVHCATLIVVVPATANLSSVVPGTVVNSAPLTQRCPMLIEETLLASDYVLKTSKASKIDPTKELSVEQGWICPSCRWANTTLLVQDVTQMCCECGLAARRWGHALKCCVQDGAS